MTHGPGDTGVIRTVREWCIFLGGDYLDDGEPTKSAQRRLIRRFDALGGVRARRLGIPATEMRRVGILDDAPSLAEKLATYIATRGDA